MSNHEIGLGRVLRADAVLVTMCFAGILPYAIVRSHGAQWYMQTAAGAIGFVVVILAFRAMGSHRKWLRETYRLTTGHADLTIESRNRSLLANVISTTVMVPAIFAIIVPPFLLPTMLPKILPSWLPSMWELDVLHAALLLFWMLSVALVVRLSIYAGVRAADRIGAWRRKRKREARRRGKQPPA